MKSKNSYFDVSVDVFSICLSTLSSLYVFFSAGQSSFGSMNFQVISSYYLYLSAFSTERVLRRLTPFTSHSALFRSESWDDHYSSRPVTA